MAKTKDKDVVGVRTHKSMDDNPRRKGGKTWVSSVAGSKLNDRF